MILDGLIGNKFSTFEHARIMGNILVLATPKKSKNINTLINYMISMCDLILSWVEILNKMFKIYKKTMTDLELKDKEAKDLKKMVE